MMLKPLLLLLLAEVIASQTTVMDMFLGEFGGDRSPEYVASVVDNNAVETTYSVNCPPKATEERSNSCDLGAGLTVIAQPYTTQVIRSFDFETVTNYGSMLCAFNDPPIVTCTRSVTYKAVTQRDASGYGEQSATYTMVTNDVAELRAPVTITGGSVTPTTDMVYTLLSSSHPTATVTLSHTAGNSTSTASSKNHISSTEASEASSVTHSSTLDDAEHATSTHTVSSSRSEGVGPLVTGEAVVVAGVAAVALAGAVIL
ncbi:uncharacterized protein BO97DRAFT_465234 [Aspergillus homomorphus CBS 101889]|uniref:GPI anchored glycoprotein n=1 Tax=Aspergillus homomorphus (strain CBS 101889) TaxID=1450537 RepID=A0A395I3L0_ASPHC|nr:hypothetical protein BO97DRAFT_465234 [Aspergillus homomorphus CBS 101889]RAL14670.1 hypothetical protein BO97DRAFT_465234 [Aspergillus homomorphus CBS 101889]